MSNTMMGWAKRCLITGGKLESNDASVNDSRV